MIPNGHITLYNKYIDPTSRGEKWQRSEVRDVVWEATKAVSGSKVGLLSSNVATVFIPLASGTQYLAPKAWQIIQTLGSSAGFWTLQESDVIVRGIVEDEITDAVLLPVPVPAFTMTMLRAKYDDVVSITSVDTMDQGSDHMRHWEVGCK